MYLQKTKASFFVHLFRKENLKKNPSILFYFRFVLNWRWMKNFAISKNKNALLKVL